MDPATAALAGSAITGFTSFLGGERRNRSNERVANRQMDFQREMSNTSYQRGMRDMQKAGLNPMLAYKQGGASAPAGSMPVMHDSITPALNTALQTYEKSASVNKSRSEVEQIAANIKKIDAATGLTKEQTLQVSAVIKNVLATEKLTKAQHRGKAQQNIKDMIVVKYFADNPMELIAREIGIGEGLLKTIIRLYIQGLSGQDAPTGDLLRKGKAIFDDYFKY